ncbi:hypothetical protein IAR55_005371 [Kwoniella newhampshirensis]|uniref:RRM domain-containing protein n=1 Tax=Kwoniella newhampshirensis TaxID=1651941 RepID=A0AAW0YTM9_9TREE
MGSFPPPPPFLPAPPRFDAFPSENGYDYRPPSTSYEGRDDGGGARRDARAPRGGGNVGGRGRSPDGRGKRRLFDRDNRSIEERVQNERVCRTLFVRNVSYDANPDELKVQFATYGEIKTYYEMVHNRGMIFITYYDLRAAERARDGMHGHHIGKRSIDVHYSLPRADDQKGDCDREKNQGSILVHVHPPRVIHENEVGRLGEQYGEIKSVRSGREPAQKIVEFYDSRGAALFVDCMQGQSGLGGTLELRFVWDELDNQLPPPPAAERGRESSVSTSDTSFGARSARRSGEGPGYGDVRSGRGNGRGPPGGGGGRGRDRSPNRRVDGRGPYPGGSSLPPPPGRYGDAPPSAPPPEDRLEQARKVQQLLASLGGGSGNPPSNQPTPLASRPPVAPPLPPSGRGPYLPQQDSYPPRSDPFPPRRESYPPPRDLYPPPRAENPYPPRQEQQYPPRPDTRFPPRQDPPYPPPRQDQQYRPPPAGNGQYQPPSQSPSYAPYATPSAPQTQSSFPPVVPNMPPPPTAYPPYPPPPTAQRPNSGLPPDVLGMLQRNGPPPSNVGQYGGLPLPTGPPVGMGGYDPRPNVSGNQSQGYAPQQQGQQTKDVGSLLAMLVSGRPLRLLVQTIR